MNKEKEYPITEEEEKEQPAFTLKKGNKKFPVYLHFKEENSETVDDKIKRLIQKTVDSGEF